MQPKKKKTLKQFPEKEDLSKIYSLYAYISSK